MAIHKECFVWVKTEQTVGILNSINYLAPVSTTSNLSTIFNSRLTNCSLYVWECFSSNIKFSNTQKFCTFLGHYCMVLGNIFCMNQSTTASQASNNIPYTVTITKISLSQILFFNALGITVCKRKMI